MPFWGSSGRRAFAPHLRVESDQSPQDGRQRNDVSSAREPTSRLRSWAATPTGGLKHSDVEICTEPSRHLRGTLPAALYAQGVSHKPRVLVVEDERTIAQAIAARLAAEGFAVDQAHDGLAALERAAAWSPELVVLDVMLPGLNGHEVCRRLQADRPVPVLMLTARDDETDLLVGLGIGADDYMTKPFSMRELVARIRALLRRVERDRSAATAAPDVNLNGLRIVGAGPDPTRCTSRRPSLTCCPVTRQSRAPCSAVSPCWRRSGAGLTPRAPGPSTAT